MSEKIEKLLCNVAQGLTPTEQKQGRDNLGLAEVAASGSYNDLVDKPSIPSAQVNSDWAETDSSSKAFILNKPELATVATSGDYRDLSHRPSIPSVGNGTITLQVNNTDVDSFTTNQSSSKSINLSVPTNVSELNNDAGYLTSVGSGNLTIQRNGVDVETFNANSSVNKTANILVPDNLYVATYNVSTFNDVLAAYNAGKAIILVGADFGSNIHTNMLMYDYNTTSGQTRKFQFAPTVVPRVAAYYKYYATLDETNGWSKDYFSNTAPTKCGGIFQLSGDEVAHDLVKHRGWLCNGIYNFDLKYFCSANACTIYLSFVDQPLRVDVVGMKRGIRNDRMASIDQTTTVQTFVRDIDVSTRIVMTDQPLSATEPRITIASLGPQEIVNYDYDVYWDLDLICTQWAVTGTEPPCYHLHIEKFGQPSAGHNYLFATLTGSDLY